MLPSSTAARLKRRGEAKVAALRGKQHACLQGEGSNNGAGRASVITPAREEAIALRSSAASLTAQIAAGQLTAQQVAKVFIRRCHLLGGPAAQGGVNALTDELYDAALARAEAIDAEVARGAYAAGDGTTPRSPPVLLGVPMSIKEHINIAGYDSTTGAAAKCFQPAAKDAVVVELLRDAGAVPLCKTNVPQCLMMPETSNRIFGTTTNPWDGARCAGGSSGGEGALIGARGSILGVGTDIGGSIRIPAHFNGVAGFKPTPSRVSDRGISLPFGPEVKFMGQKAVRLTAGPMALYVEDLALVLKAWWVEKMWRLDPFVIPLPFDDATYRRGPQPKRKIRLGYFLTDHWFQPCRASVRAVKEAAAKLEATGEYECVELDLGKAVDGWEVTRLFYTIMAAEGSMHSYIQGLEGEPLDAHYAKLYLATTMPDFLRPLVSAALYLLGEERLRHSAAGLRRGGISAREYWAMCGHLEAYQRAWLGILDAQNLDGFLCPASALAAFPHGASRQLECSCTYTFAINLLHFPAGVVPVTRVREEEALYPLEDLPAIERDSLAREADRCMRGAAGLPIGVQVVTRPYQDELCLHVMKALQDATHFTRDNMPDMAKRHACSST